MESSHKRIFYFDAIRAFAIIMVLLVHISNSYPLVNSSIMAVIPFWGHDIGVLGVPLFFMVMGALLLGRDYPSIRFFIRKRFIRVFYPFVFWMIVYVLLCFFIDRSYSGAVYSLLTGNEGFTWFVFALIGVYLFVPVVNAFIEKYGIRAVEYFLAIWFFIIVYEAAGLNFETLNLHHFSRYFGYLVLGYYISNKEFKLRDSIIKIIGWVLAIGFMGVNFYVTFRYNVSLTYLTLPVVLESVGVYILFRYSNRINNVKYSDLSGRITFAISKYSYGMYFTHMIVIVLLFRLFDLVSYSPLLIPLILAVVVLFSWSINFAMGRIPFLKKFSGA